MYKSLFQRLVMTLTLLIGAMSAATAADTLYVGATYVEPGKAQTLTLNIDNATTYYGFQVDIMLPKGLEFELEDSSLPINLSSRFDSSYSLLSNLLNSASLRVGAFSSTHSPIEQNSGELLQVKVRANEVFEGGEVILTNIHFVGANDKDISFPDFSQFIRNQAENRCYIPDFTISEGQTETISIIIDNEIPFTAFQTDIFLPAGIRISGDSFQTTSRTTNHSISTKSFSDGRTRIICFSTSNDIVSPGIGSVVEFSIEAASDMEGDLCIDVRCSMLSSSNAEEYYLPDSKAIVTVEASKIKGDVDEDGRISVFDVTRAIDVQLSGEELDRYLPIVDMNGDGKITVIDITSIISLILNN